MARAFGEKRGVLEGEFGDHPALGAGQELGAFAPGGDENGAGVELGRLAHEVAVQAAAQALVGADRG